MSILIKGMEMPDYGYVCLKVFANGEVLMTKEHRGALVITGIKDKVGTAVPVPEHGRMIDADALIEWLYSDEPNALKAPFRLCTADRSDVIFLLKNAPTIIPADPKEEGE